MKVVCNTSPLILLGKIRRLDLLLQLYDSLLVPPSVLHEVMAKPGDEQGQLTDLFADDRCHVLEVTSEAVARVPADLGVGERDAIVLALQEQADLLVLDDHQGRLVAQHEGIRITGTIGVLVEAWARGMLPSVRHELDQLIAEGMWVGDALYRRIVAELGE